MNCGSVSSSQLRTGAKDASSRPLTVDTSAKRSARASFSQTKPGKVQPQWDVLQSPKQYQLLSYPHDPEMLNGPKLVARMTACTCCTAAGRLSRSASACREGARSSCAGAIVGPAVSQTITAVAAKRRGRQEPTVPMLIGSTFRASAKAGQLLSQLPAPPPQSHLPAMSCACLAL